MNTSLYYIIGASGAGKDSLISYVRGQLDDSANVAFAHRYITRDADAGSENHVALSLDEFNNRLAKGCFAMHWSSHGLHYGIGSEILDWQAQGFDVVVNGSRAYLPEAAQKFPCLKPILIDVDTHVLEARLNARGRESQDEILKRLERAKAFSQTIEHPELTRVHNNHSLEEAGQSLLSIIQASK